MTYYTDNPAFIPNTNVQKYVDASSLDPLDQCPHKYYLSQVQDWRAKKEAIDLAFGLRYASHVERYHKLVAGVNLPAPMPHDEALATVAGEALRDPWDSDPAAKNANIKNRRTLIRSIVWYLDQFGPEDPCRTLILADGNPAVEVSFRMELPWSAPDGDPYVLCGHIDRLVEFNGKRWATDNKTTGSTLGDHYFKRYKLDTQMSIYTIAAQAYAGAAQGVIIDAAQVAAGFTRFTRGHALRNRENLDEFIEDLGVLLRQAREYAEADYWPRRRSSCDRYGGCQFRDVCGSIPKLRDGILQSNFIRQRWDPTIPR